MTRLFGRFRSHAGDGTDDLLSALAQGRDCEPPGGLEENLLRIPLDYPVGPRRGRAGSFRAKVALRKLCYGVGLLCLAVVAYVSASMLIPMRSIALADILHAASGVTAMYVEGVVRDAQGHITFRYRCWGKRPSSSRADGFIDSQLSQREICEDGRKWRWYKGEATREQRIENPRDPIRGASMEARISEAMAAGARVIRQAPSFYRGRRVASITIAHTLTLPERRIEVFVELKVDPETSLILWGRLYTIPNVQTEEAWYAYPTDIPDSVFDPDRYMPKDGETPVDDRL